MGDDGTFILFYTMPGCEFGADALYHTGCGEPATMYIEWPTGGLWFCAKHGEPAAQEIREAFVRGIDDDDMPYGDYEEREFPRPTRGIQ